MEKKLTFMTDFVFFGFLFIIFLLLQIIMTKLSNDPRSVLNKVTWGYKVLDPETVFDTVVANLGKDY